MPTNSVDIGKSSLSQWETMAMTVLHNSVMQEDEEGTNKQATINNMMTNKQQ
jgi:hypothetical protein